MKRKEWTLDIKESLDRFKDEQYKKAFAKGTTKAWRQYYKAVSDRITTIENEYDVSINREIFFAN